MSEAKLNIHVETLTDSSYVPSFTAKITVTSADGVSPCVFVHMYTPKCAGNAASYEFMNVAYYDELTSVPDYLKSKKQAQLIRLAEITKGLPNKEELEDFINTVQHDVQRLLVQVNTTTVSGECLDVEITAGTISTAVSDECSEEPKEFIESELAPGVITLSFDGTTVTEN